MPRPVDIHCSVDQCDNVKYILDSHSIQFYVGVEDLSTIAGLHPMKHSSNDSERSGKQSQCLKSSFYIYCVSGHNMDWEDWHTMADMYTYLNYLEQTYTWVTTQTIGQSFEGQEMRVVEVCRGGCGSKPGMWIDGGIHAREWISPAVNTYLLRELVENDGAHPDLTEELDW